MTQLHILCLLVVTQACLDKKQGGMLPGLFISRVHTITFSREITSSLASFFIFIRRSKMILLISLDSCSALAQCDYMQT